MKEELAAVEQRLKALEEQVKTIVASASTPTSRIKTETETKIKTEPETKPKSEFKPQQTVKSELKGPVTPETLEVSTMLERDIKIQYLI
jgi:F0F1-type ATP synthase membrane subunit b/b'